MFLRPHNKIVDLIFDNIKIVFLLFIFLVVFGGISLSQMQRQGFPEVLVNVAAVNVVYPSANASQMEDQVLEPLEASVKDLDVVTEYSSSASDSWAGMYVTFDQNADLDQAFAEFKNAVTSVDLPEDAQEPVVTKFSASGAGDFIVAATGFDTTDELYEGGQVLEDALEGLEGVKEVVATNPLTPEILIDFDLDALEEHGLTRSEVEQIISLSGFSAPIGSYEEDGEEIGVILTKELTSLTDLRTLPITEDLELRDIADIDVTLNDGEAYNYIGFKDGDSATSDLAVEPALLYAVKLDAGADILVVDEALQELIDDNILEDGRAVVVYSQADATRLQIEEITQSIFGAPIDSLGSLSFLGYLLGGLTLVVILLLVFMNLRVAIMAALAIPLSLFFASIYLSFAGISLNTLVLFSMVLTIGLVVDPTIVFLESMQRYKAQGYSGREAAALTMKTVGAGVFLAVMTNILVFVPFGVVSGFFGEIIKYIPATVIPAMIASMVIPVLFFVPLASKILPSKGRGTWKLGDWVGSSVLWLLGAGKGKVALRVFVLIVVSLLPFLVGGALIGSGAVEVVQFSEQDDSEFLLVNADVNNEWTFENAVHEVAVPLQEELKDYPEIKNFSYFEQSGNSFTILVTLLPIDVRSDEGMRTSDEVAAAINEGIEERGIDAVIEASTSSEGPPQEEFPVRVRIYGDDDSTLMAAAEDVSDYLEGVDGISRVQMTGEEGNSGGSITFVLDNDELVAQNPLFVYSVLKDRIGQNDLGEVTFGDEAYELVSVVSPEVVRERTLTEVQIATPEDLVYQQQLAALLAEGVENPEAILEEPDPTYVRDLLEEKEVRESETIQRSNGERYVEVYASVDDDADAIAIQSDLQEYLDGDKLDDLNLDEQAIDFEGEADSIAESFTDLFIALAISIFLIYVLLVGFFRSYLEPFIILFAIPLGLVGVFGAVAATTGQLGFLELLGVVAMAGIVVNVTILLIDYANQLKRDGSSPAEAIAESVATRFRPIILTQLTAFGSLIPLVYLSPFWKGLAAAIIFGIVSSALLSLFVTPILYLWANTAGTMLGRIPMFFRKLRIAYKNIE